MASRTRRTTAITFVVGALLALSVAALGYPAHAAGPAPQLPNPSPILLVDCFGNLFNPSTAIYATSGAPRYDPSGKLIGYTVVGTSGNDVIIGSSLDDIIYGLDGDDVICAGAGNDTVYGGYTTLLTTDNDQIAGQDGDDTLYGEVGDDTIRCGAGNDTADGGTGTDTAGPGCETVVNVP